MTTTVRWAIPLIMAGVVLFSIPATAQTVIFSETFSVPDTALLNGVVNLDNQWFFSSSGPGPAIVSGAMVSQQGVTWDAGMLVDAYTLEPGLLPFIVEFDITVNTIGTFNTFGVQFFDDDGFGGLDIFIRTDGASGGELSIGAYDSDFNSDEDTINGASFVAGTTYHFFAMIDYIGTLDGFVSITATSGPGSDIVNSAFFSLAVDAENTAPLGQAGFVSSEGVTFDNLTVTVVGTPAMPVSGAPGAFALLLTLGALGVYNARRPSGK